MPVSEIDQYLAEVTEPGRSTLDRLRQDLRSLLPDAKEGIAYATPAFRLGGTPVAGFAAFADHLSYLPHSGTVLAVLADEVRGYRCSKGALRFPVDEPLPRSLVAKLVEARLAELTG